MSKGTILIIDKERHTQWAMRTLLEIEGYVAVGVNSVEEASEEIRRGGVCGIIAEYRADHHCTRDLIRELKKGFPEIYVMMLTGEDLAEDKYEEVMEAGVDDYFLKPLSTQKILIHLRKGLGRRTLFLEKNRLEHELDQVLTRSGRTGVSKAEGSRRTPLERTSK